MRRTDREVTDFGAKMEIVGKCQVCRIAMTDGSVPYIVPMNFGYEVQSEKLTLFFHSASRGRKIDLLASCPQVAFEMDVPHGVITADSACRHSFGYESVMGYGRVRFLTRTEDKIRALNAIMSHAAGFIPERYEEKWLDAVTAFEVEVRECTAKRRE